MELGLGSELGLDEGMVEVGLAMAQLRLTIGEDVAGFGHGDGEGGADCW